MFDGASQEDEKRRYIEHLIGHGLPEDFLLKIFVCPSRFEELALALMEQGLGFVDLEPNDQVSPSFYYIIPGHSEVTFPGIPRRRNDA